VRLNECRAIITGGASGLGEATVRAIAAVAGRVAIFDLVKETGEKLASELGKAAVFCQVDVSDEEQVKVGVQTAIQVFGGVDVLVNCAGIGIPSKVLSKDGPMPLETFAKVVKINLIGTFNVMRLVAVKMVNNQVNSEGERGVIINTASVAAFEGQIGQASYSASKAGIVGMTLPMAREFASIGIRVLTIAPGLFDTPMMASLPDFVREALSKSVPFPKRLGRPNEFAQMVICMIQNSMLNGETIRLDGALRMQPR